MNYYQFHIGDFRSGTVNMSRKARWIYRDMLDVYYDTEEPLPLDIEILCDALGVECDDEVKTVERILKFKFEKTEDGYRHSVCERVIAEFHTKADQARTNGKSGGRPRNNPDEPKRLKSKTQNNQAGFGNNPVGFENNQAGFHENPSGLKNNPVATGLKANQEPLTNSDTKVSDAKPSFKSIIFNHGVQLLQDHGVGESSARSFLGKHAKSDESKLAEVIGYLMANPKIEPRGYIESAMQPPKRGLVL